MKKLSQEDKESISAAFKYANTGQLLRVFIWNIFYWRKRDKLIDCLIRGMHFESAYNITKKS